MIADFRQYYALDLPFLDEAVDEEIDLRRLALLWSELPPGSRCKSDAGGWSESVYMLRSLEYHARLIAWQNTKDAQKGVNQPVPIKSPAERAEAERARDEAITIRDELAARLGLVE